MLRVSLLLVALATVSAQAQPTDARRFVSPIMDGAKAAVSQLPERVAQTLSEGPATREGGAYIREMSLVNVRPDQRLYILMQADDFASYPLVRGAVGDDEGRTLEVYRRGGGQGIPQFVSYHNQTDRSQLVRIVASSVEAGASGPFQIQHRLQQEDEPYATWTHYISQIDGTDDWQVTDDADRGRRADAYPLSLQRGQTLIVHAGTEAFRPTLTLIGPSGYIGHVDGSEDTPSLASFTYQAEQSGRYTLLVSTVGLEDAGGYLVRMRVPAE